MSESGRHRRQGHLARWLLPRALRACSWVLAGYGGDHRSWAITRLQPGISAAASSVNLAAIANTYRFDSAVSSNTGDVWAQSVDASAPYSPLTLAPGQSGTITLTITPSARRGTVVHGFVGVDTLNLATASGDELIQIPHAYRVG